MKKTKEHLIIKLQCDGKIDLEEMRRKEIDLIWKYIESHENRLERLEKKIIDNEK